MFWKTITLLHQPSLYTLFLAKVLEWKSNYFANSKRHPISKQERCQIVTKRLQRYDDNQMIPYYLTAEDNLNGSPVICVIDIDRRNCSKQDVLITFQPGTDPTAVLSQIRYFRRGAVGVDRLYLSGDDVVSYHNGNPYVDVRELTK